MKIVGLVGLIGSGKNTVAEMFVQQGYTQDSFAKPLKDLTAAVFGWPRPMLEGDTTESREFRETTDLFWSRKLGIDNFTPRLALQVLGTDLFRKQFQEGIWRHSLEYRLRCCATNNIVISDARFRNELDLIQGMSGKIVWVQRGKLPEWWDTACEANQGSVTAEKVMRTRYRDIHESEWNWAGSKVDYVIYNNGTIDELCEKVNSICLDLK
jgi:hypothetical protein